MRYGTEAQRARFLPDIREGKIRFCLGYSEPGSGSDLASLKTSARREGNEWVINGQKLWTTGAEKADYMWLAARTDPDAKPVHAGISIFIVPMNAPGMTVRPSMALYGHTFCTEFLDNVRVPADALVGELNGGWKILTSALATERILMGGSVTLALAVFNDLLSHVRTSSDTDGEPLRLDGAARDRLACLASEIEVARQLLAHSVRMVEAGKVPLHEAAMSKVYTGELLQRVGETAIDIGGMGITLEEGQAGAITDGRMEQMLRRSIMMVVGGGTAEIQRSLIAQRGLGLPR
jgi:alkylation response protein AidB-like acyl-CoA dehydrogenase